MPKNDTYSVLQKLREDAGMSVEEVAKKAMISVERLTKIENGEESITPTEVTVMASLFNVSAAALTDGRIEKVDGDELAVLIESAKDQMDSLKNNISQLKAQLDKNMEHMVALNNAIDKLQKDYLGNTLGVRAEAKEMDLLKDEAKNAEVLEGEQITDPMVTIEKSASPWFKDNERMTLFEFEQRLQRAWVNGTRSGAVYDDPHIKYRIDILHEGQKEVFGRKIFHIGSKPSVPIIYANIIDGHEDILRGGESTIEKKSRFLSKTLPYLGKYLALSSFAAAVRLFKEQTVGLGDVAEAFTCYEEYVATCKRCLIKGEDLPAFDPAPLDNISLEHQMLTGDYTTFNTSFYLVSSLPEEAMKPLGYEFIGDSNNYAYKMYKHSETKCVYAIRNYSEGRHIIDGVNNFRLLNMRRRDRIVSVELDTKELHLPVEVAGDCAYASLAFDLFDNRLGDNINIAIEHRGSLFNALHHSPEEIIHTKIITATCDSRQKEDIFESLSRFVYEGKTLEDLRGDYIKERELKSQEVDQDLKSQKIDIVQAEQAEQLRQSKQLLKK